MKINSLPNKLINIDPLQLPELHGISFKEFLEVTKIPNINKNTGSSVGELLSIQNQIFNQQIRVELLSRVTESCSATIRRLQAQ